MAIGDEKYMSFTTFRKNGDPVSSPTWVVPVSDGRVGFWTAMGSGKTKRLKNNPKVTVQASDVRGNVKDGFPLITGEAEMVQSGRLFDEVHAKVRAKYGFMTKLTKVMGKVMGQRKAGQTYADTVVLVRLDS
ncbi:PPOX class F420-dependent oxidoreductase [Nocardioides sp. KIGAM211]|uniref:PPOX class F420-dependent oxidoreductase n=1 Tax=Nocardioides luti TaxID=2761101 RepID=A0A7X0RE48_9ACTN|nr:PPOX class F420-dependent oxidoreductase [Nocardioides luti]MBB6626647.1 PPOX class F420-dependent oxidoreductase [Nocardioides luti]